MRHGILAAAVFAGPARAELTFVADRADLGADQTLDWGGLPPAPTHLPDPLNYGDVTVSQPGAPFLVRSDQAPAGTPTSTPNLFFGNFSGGDNLLVSSSGGGTGPLVLTFAGDLSAAGAQIQDFFAGDFTAEVEAFDAAGNSLGNFTRAGVSTDAADGSAIFLGVRSDIQDIRSIALGLTDISDGNTGAFAINQASLASTRIITFSLSPPPPPQAPEPGSLALMGIGLAGLGAARRRRPATR